MGSLLTIIFTFLDLWTPILFAHSFSDFRWNRKRTLCIILVFFALTLAPLYLIPGDFYIIPASLIVLGLLITIFRGPWYKQLLALVLSYILTGILDTCSGYGVCALLGMSYDEFIWKKMMYTVVVLSSKLIAIFIGYIFFQYWKNRKSAPIRISWLLLLVLFPAVSLIMLVIIFTSFQDQEDWTVNALIFAIALAVANVAIVYLITVMEKRTREEQQLRLMNQQMEIQTESILALEKSYRSQRAVTHEFQNQLQTISNLLSGGKYEDVQDYLHQLQEAHVTRVLAVNTHHPIMDAILNQKYQLAVENKIDIQIQVNDLSGIRIPTNSLVVLFSNLLDNAIEACQRLPDHRAIRCSIIASDVLYISIRNTSQSVCVTDGLIQTSKASKSEHGFGLLSIKRILEEQNAEYAFQYENDWFHFAAEIPI